MTDTAIDILINSCDTIARHTDASSVRLFNSCMRTFDSELAANAITFEVFFYAPIMAPGFVRIFRDGSYRMATTKALMQTGEYAEWVGE